MTLTESFNLITVDPIHLVVHLVEKRIFNYAEKGSCRNSFQVNSINGRDCSRHHKAKQKGAEQGRVLIKTTLVKSLTGHCSALRLCCWTVVAQSWSLYTFGKA